MLVRACSQGTKMAMVSVGGGLARRLGGGKEAQRRGSKGRGLPLPSSSPVQALAKAPRARRKCPRTKWPGGRDAKEQHLLATSLHLTSEAQGFWALPQEVPGIMPLWVGLGGCQSL